MEKNHSEKLHELTNNIEIHNSQFLEKRKTKKEDKREQTENTKNDNGSKEKQGSHPRGESRSIYKHEERSNERHTKKKKAK